MAVPAVSPAPKAIPLGASRASSATFETFRAAAIAVACLAFAPSAAPAASTGRLLARPPVHSSTLAPATPKAGLVTVEKGAFLYVPPSLAAPDPAPAPLLLLFPGTNGDGLGMISAFRPYADRHRFLLLAFSPRLGRDSGGGPGGNFDATDNFFDDREARRQPALADWPAPRFGADVPRIDRALAQVFARARVDAARIGLLGFSHGGSYALSLGTANPDLFASIHALSPGILILPGDAAGGQSVFLSHGQADDVQPFRRTACAFVPRLAVLGYRLRFAPFDGGHALNRGVADAAIDHFLTAQRPPPALRLRAGERRGLCRDRAR